MKEYIASEFLKEKKQKHIYLAIICLSTIAAIFISNSYKLMGKAGILDLYCDNIQMYFFVTLIFSLLYTVVLFGDEYRYQTIYQLQMIPIKPLKFIFSKMIMVVCFNAFVMISAIVECILIIVVHGFHLTVYSIIIFLMINLVDILLLTMVMLPVALLVICCKENTIISLILSTGYIMLGLIMPGLPLKQEIAQKMTTYLHPLGSYALIHNWLIYKFIPYETSMILKPEENAGLALIGLMVWSIICCKIMQVLMKKSRIKRKTN